MKISKFPCAVRFAGVVGTVFRYAAAFVLPAAAFGGGSLIISDFEDETAQLEGWTVFTPEGVSSDIGDPRWEAEGGNPGGYFAVEDLAAGGVIYFSAPAKFLGDQSASAGLLLGYDVSSTTTNSSFSRDDVVLEGGGLRLLYRHSPSPSPDGWESFIVPLEPTNGWRVMDAAEEWNGHTGGDLEDAPTAAEFAAVLGDLAGLFIRGEYWSGSSSLGLDNVVLQSADGTGGYDPETAAAEWLGGSGNWKDAELWSSDPLYPANSILRVFDATIDTLGAAYTVDVTSGVTVDSVTVDFADATLAHSGGTFRPGALTVERGTYRLSGGATLADAVLSFGENAEFRASSNTSNTFSNVTLGSDAALAEDSARVRIVNGFTLAGNTFVLRNRGTRLYIDEDWSLEGGTLRSDPDLGSWTRDIWLRDGNALTVADGGVLRGGRLDVRRSGGGDRFFINEGLVSADEDGETIRFYSDVEVTNTGTMEARDGGELRIDNFINGAGGTFVVDGGRILLDGQFTDVGSVSNLDGDFDITGIFDLSGSAYTIDADMGPWRLVGGGGIRNGTLALAEEDLLRFTNNTSNDLYDITLASNLTLAEDSSYLAVNGGFALGGNTLTLRNRGTRIYVDEDLSLGSGTIFSDSAPGSWTRDIWLRNDDTTLTLGTGATLRGGRLDVRRSGGGDRFFINEGLVSANEDGETIRFFSDVEVTNTGTLEARDGGELVIDNLASTSGTVAALDGGQIEIDGDWTNTGTFVIDGGTLVLNGSFSDPGTIDRTEGNFRVSGDFDLGGGTYTIDENNGPWRVQSGGAIRNGTLVLSEPEMLSFTNNTANRLYDITLASDLTLAEDSSYLSVNGGFVLDGVTLTLRNRGTRLYVDEDLTLASGTIHSDPAPGSWTRDIWLRNDDTTLTLGAVATLRGGRLDVRRSGGGDRFFINEGLVSADEDGESLRFFSDIEVTNTGTLEARDGGELVIDNLVSTSGTVAALDGGQVEIDGDWTNTGTFVIDGGTLLLNGSFNDPGTIDRTGGNFNISGDFDIGGGTYTIDESNGPWRLQSGGTIRNGTLVLSDPEMLRFSSSTSNRLYDILLASDLTLADDSATFAVNGGFALDGNTLTLRNRSSRIYVDEDLTLSSGTIYSDPGPGSWSRNLWLRNSGTTLTLGAGATLRGGRLDVSRSGGGDRFFVNEGLVSADEDGETIHFSSTIAVTNIGTLEARDGGTLRIDDLVANSGTIRALEGSHVEIGGAWTNTGTIEVDGGMLEIDGDWSNEGGTILLDGADFNLGGNVALSDLGTINRTGGTFRVSGDLDLEGATLTLDETNGPWIVQSGGVIRNGTIVLSDPEMLRFSSSTSNRLYDILLASDLTLAEDSATFAVNGGFALDGVTLTLRNRSSRIYVDEDLTLSAGTIYSDPGPGSWSRNLWLRNSGTTLTLGAGATLRGGRLDVSRSGGGDRFFVNEGLVSADEDGETIHFSSTIAVTNDSTMEARDGGRLRIDDLVANSGTIRAMEDSHLEIGGAWTNTGTIEVDGGTLEIDGDWSNEGGTILLDGADFNLGGNVALSDLGTINRTGGTFRVSGDLDLEGATLTIDETNGPWIVQSGGVIRNGTIVLSDPEMLRFSSSTSNRLYDILLASDVTLAEDSATFAVNGGFALDGVTLTLRNRSSRIYVDEDLTLSAGTIYSDPGPGSWSRNLWLRNSGTTLTLGAGATLRGGLLDVRRTGSGERFFVNEGLVSANEDGEEIRFYSDVEVTNTSTLEARDGGRLRIDNMAANTGTVFSGAGSRILIDDDFTTGPSTELQAGIPGAPVPLQVDGTASLGGTLTISTHGDYIPSLGDSFVLLEADNIEGAFDTIEIPLIDGQPLFEVAVNDTRIEVTVADLAPLVVVGPTPADGATDIVINPTLSWTRGAFAESYEVYLGTSPSLGEGDLVATTTAREFDPDVLDWDTTYYWRVDAVNEFGTSNGTVWSFTTRPEPDPDLGTVWIAADGLWTDGENWTSAPDYPDNDSPDPGVTYDVVIEAGGEYTITLDADVTIDRLIIDAPGATLRHTSGTLTVLDSVQVLRGTYQMDGGTLREATLSVGGEGTIAMTGNSRLHDVTLHESMDFSIPNSRILYVSGDLTLDGATLRLASTGSNTRLRFDDGEEQNILGSGEIIYDGSGSDSNNRLESWSTGTHVIISAGITVRTGARGGLLGSSRMVTNNGTIIADEPGRVLAINTNEPFANNGLLEVSGGSAMVIEELSGNLNSATITGAESSLDISGDYTVNEALSVPADATLSLSGDWIAAADITATGATLLLSGSWSNTAVLSATDSMVQLGGNFTLADLGTFNRDGGTVRITGTLENEGTTLTLDTSTGGWDLHGGRIRGGTLAHDGASLGMTADGTFADVTLDSSVDLPIPNNRILTIEGDLTLDDAVVRLVSTGSNTRLRFSDNDEQNILGEGEIVFDGSGSDSNNRIESWNSGTHLFIAEDITVRTGERGGSLGASRRVTNFGRILADAPGRTLSVDPNEPFHNEGSIEAREGGRIDIDNFESDTGTLHADAGSRIVISGDYASGESLTLLVAGPESSDYGRLTVSGDFSPAGHLEVAFADGYLPDVGERYDIVDAGAVIGEFETVNLPDVPGETEPEIIYDADLIAVLVSGSPPAPVENPSPSDGSENRAIDTFVSWVDGGLASSFDVSFGTNPTPGDDEFRGNQVGSSYDPGALDYATTYYWRVDARNQNGVTEGPVWSFTTRPEPASISGVVWHDETGDGEVGAEEPRLEGWTVYLDLNNNGVRNAGEPRVFTDADGSFSFGDLMPGEYVVRQIVQNTWSQTSPPDNAAQVVTVAAGEDLTDVNFGNQQIGPVVTNVALSRSQPVPASDDLRITVRFDRTMDTSVEPTLELQPQEGQDAPIIPAGGEWHSQGRSNNAYRTPAITITPGMDGEHVLHLSGATDPAGRVGDPADIFTLTVNATPPPVVVPSVTEITPNSLTIAWDEYEAPGDINLFRVYLEEEPFTSLSGLNAHDGRGASARSYTFTGLDLDTEYHVAVGAVDSVLNMDRDVASIPVIIESDVPPPVVPDLSRPRIGEAMLDWSHYGTGDLIGFAGYRVYVEDEAYSDVTGLTPAAEAGPGETGLLLTGLDRSRELHIAVVPFNRLGEYVSEVTTVLWRDILADPITEDLTLGAEGETLEVPVPLVVQEGAVLTIPAGATLVFAEDAGIVVEDGALRSLGTKAKPVHLTSANESGRGHWAGVTLGENAGASELYHTWIRHGGGLLLDGAVNPMLHGLRLVWNEPYGLRARDGAVASADALFVALNETGVSVDGGSSLTLWQSVIKNNTVNASSDSGGFLDARDNWWGFDDPDDIADSVSGAVDISDPLDDEPVLAAFAAPAGGETQTGSQVIDIVLNSPNALSYRASEDSTFSGVFFEDIDPDDGGGDLYRTEPFTVPFTLSDGGGVKTVYVELRSVVGGVSDPIVIEIEYITEGPVITAFSLSEGDEFARPVEVSGSAEAALGLAEVGFYVNDEAVLTDDGPDLAGLWDFRGMSSGIYRVRFEAVDTAGNLATQELNVRLSPEPPPTPTLDSPSDGDLFADPVITVSGTAEPGIEVRLTRNGSIAGTTHAASDGTYSFPDVTLAEGSNALVARARDIEGSSPSSPVVVNLDTVPPVAPIIESAEYLVRFGIEVVWSNPPEGKQAGRFRVLWHDEPFSSASEASGQGDLVEEFDYRITGIPDGDYYVAVVGVDAAGNVSELSDLLEVTYDSTPPAFTVAYDSPIPVGPGDLAITLTVSETLRSTPSLTIQPANFSVPVHVSLEETGPNTYTGTYAVSPLSGSTGVAAVKVSGRDLAGNSYSGPPAGPELIFDVERPTAAIEVNLPQPVQVLEGEVVVGVALTTSKSVLAAPELTFEPPEGTSVTVSLSGEGTEWQGELILTPEMGTGKGTFVFSATDALGNSGNAITEGDELEIYNTEDAPPPPRPTGVEATTMAGGTIAVQWQPSEGAEIYHLYRAEGAVGDTPTERVATLTDLSELILFDTPPEDGMYRYVVTAERLGSESDPSVSRSAESDRTPPEPPENLTVELTLSGRVEISWDAPSSGETPEFYFLYRSTTGEVSDDHLRAYRNAGTVNDAPPRGLVTYWVASSDAVGNENLSEPASIEMFVGAVSNLRAVRPHGSQAFLQWTGEDNEAVGYNVYQDGESLTPDAPVTDEFLPLSIAADAPPATFIVRAVDSEGRESAGRAVSLFPVDVGIGYNPDGVGDDRDLIRDYFENYEARASNPAEEEWRFDEIEITRRVSGSDPVSFTRVLGEDENTVAAEDSGAWSIVFPGPTRSVSQSEFDVELRRIEDDGSIAVHRRTFTGPESGRVSGQVGVSVDAAPLAGGLSDFTARFHNRGYADMDILLVRRGGQDPGNLVLEVRDEVGNVVNSVAFDRPLTGMSVAPDGRGYFRLAPGESRTVVFEDVLIPEQLGETGFASIRVSSGEIYHDLGGADERVSGPLTGSMTTNLTETPYYGVLESTAPGFADDQPVTLTGEARDRDTDAPVPDAELSIGIQIRGYHWFETVTTDESGAFTFVFDPPPGLAGSINFWAAHPDVVDILNQAEVSLLRMLSNPSRGSIRMSKNDTLDFNIQLINPGEIPLTLEDIEAQAYIVDVDDEGEEILTEIDTLTASLADPLPDILDGNRRQRVSLRLQSDLDAPDFARIEIRFSSEEGAGVTFRGDVTLLEPVPILRVESPSRGFVDRSLDRGDIRSQRVVIENAGLRDLEGVELIPPQDIDWMQVNLPADEDGVIRLPDLAVGDDIEFQVVYTPPLETDLGFYDDVIVVRGSNAVADFEIGVLAEITSNLSGDALFSVTNILDQEVPNARLRLRNTTNRLERGPYPTDSVGEALVEDLQEGRWTWQVTAPGHAAATGTVNIEADQVTLVEPELSKSLVTVTFDVVPVPFTDRYDIRLEMTFETRVPLPVLVMTPPKYSFENVEPGFETTVMFEIRNEGLVSINNVEITGSRTGLSMKEPLIDFIPELRPEQVVQIPARIRLLTEEEAEQGIEPAGLPPLIPGCGSSDPRPFAQGINEILRLAGEGDAIKASGEGVDIATGALSVMIVYAAIANSGLGNFLGELINCATGGLSFGSSPSRGTGTRGRPGRAPPRFEPSGNGCFLPDTPVRLADGSLKPIAELRSGDVVRSGAAAEAVSEVRNLFELESDDLRRLALRCLDGRREARELMVTGAHRLWVDGKGWTHVREIEAGDWLSAEGGGHWKVAAAEKVEGTHTVYNFQLKDDRGFYANGVLAEDLCGGAFVDLSTAREVTAK